MNKQEFKDLAKNYNVIPVYETITADLLTPVLAYLRIREKGKFTFLLESVEGIGRLARYSFIGHSPSSTIISDNNKIIINEENKTQEINSKLLDYLSAKVDSFKHPKIDELPDFTGGIVGYLGFEIMREIESTIIFNNKKDDEFPEAMLGLFDSIIAFDHYKHRIILIQNVFVDENSDLDKLFENAKSKMEHLKTIIQKPVELPETFKLTGDIKDKIKKELFNKKIESSKKNIYDGDVFQLVLSERFSSEYEGDLANVYRALRIINPSPYMFILEFDENLSIIGTSPEDLLKVNNQRATILPIAGTRRRGKTEEEDLDFEKELLADEKEIAEHTMLVDLARNDLGRVCKHNTVEVTEMMNIHRFSHVMHIVSRVEGDLKDDKNCIDAFKASFPAGTVSGAPKIRAIQLIEDYEEISRGPYAGSVGYIDFKGNMDMCIAIRTLFADNKKIYWQAGAGIVADSKAELELKEIKNKAAVLESALKYAEVIDESFSH
ncbi:MAG: anthranilate synthase component I [Ignavibacteriales bacterium]|nr:anthranilate synthase component I [Ignavibacteriales bacterium]